MPNFFRNTRNPAGSSGGAEIRVSQVSSVCLSLRNCNNRGPINSLPKQLLRYLLRKLLRLLAERGSEPSAAILDGRTLQSVPESGRRAGYDGHKRKKGSKVHVAVDTLGHLLTLVVTAANEQDRDQVCRRHG